MNNSNTRSNLLNRKKFLCISVLFVFILGVSSIPSSYADHTNVSVNITKGSSVPGCEENNTCFDSSQITIDVLSIVTWKNSDSTAHTVTSTNPTVQSDNIFDSGLIMAGDSFSQKFEHVGTFDYTCNIHPWMTGVIIVQDTFDEKSEKTDNSSSTQESKDKFPFSGIAAIIIPFTDDSHDCKESGICFIPMDLTIEKDTLVVWHNFDDSPRSIASGNPIDGPDGVFESGIIEPGEIFTYRFESQTIHEYYDKTYHWETGKITVTGKIIDKADRMTIIEGMSSDGTIIVNLEVMNPTEGKAMGIHAKFTDEQGDLIKNLNYDLTAVQNEHNVLTIDNNHSNAGIEEYWTAVLPSGDPVNVKITLLGIGIPGQENDWTGPKGDIIMFNVVPEFGTIAMMILVVSIVSVVGISAKSNLSLKL
ncbi:cupredoxin domain-containing protein [Nitrosopumilus sp. S6]